MKKKLIILFILPFFLTGCITYTELNELEVVQTLAIDYKDNMYYIVANLIEKNEEETTIRTQNANGNTLEEAVTNMKIKENKKLYIAHLNLLLITPNIIEEKLDETLKYFLEKKESRNDFQVALTNDISILENEQDGELSKKITIIEEDTGTTASIILEDLLKDLLEKNTTSLPFIEKIENTLQVNGIALLNQNKITYLEKEEAIFWNMLHKNLKKATIDNYQILSSNTSINYKKNVITVEVTSILEEEKENYEEVLNKKIQTIYEKYKNQDLDIFEFQKIIDRVDSKKNTSYQDLEIKVKAKVKNNEKTSAR